MLTKSRILTALVVPVLLAFSAGLARADKAALQEKLGENIKIRLKDVTIAEALDQISKKAGVEIVLSDHAEWKLPQGAATRLSVTLDGPLAASLTDMLNAFFMRYAVGQDNITVYPRPELDHIIGRPSAGQLELLNKIYCNKFALAPPVTQDRVIQMTRQVLGEASFVPYEVPIRISKVLENTVGQETSMPVTFALLLEQVWGSRPWYISTMDFPNQVLQIRLVSEAEFRDAKLGQLVDISFKDKKAETTLQMLASWAGMELALSKREPSWLEQRTSIEMQNVKLSQAIINLVTAMDGTVEIDSPNNRIRALGPLHEMKPQPEQTSKPQEQPRPEPGDYVGKISIPMEGGKYYIEFMLREKDLTNKLRALWKKRMQEILEGPELVEMPFADKAAEQGKNVEQK